MSNFRELSGSISQVEVFPYYLRFQLNGIVLILRKSNVDSSCWVALTQVNEGEISLYFDESNQIFHVEQLIDGKRVSLATRAKV